MLQVLGFFKISLSINFIKEFPFGYQVVIMWQRHFFKHRIFTSFTQYRTIKDI